MKLRDISLSVYNEICGDKYGSLPRIDLDEEIKNGSHISSNQRGRNYCHDVSEGEQFYTCELSIKNNIVLKSKYPKR